MSIVIQHVDLAQGLPALTDTGHVVHRLYFWWRSRLLGVTQLAPWQAPIPPARLARLAAHAIAPAVADLLRPGSPFAAQLPDDPPQAPRQVPVLDMPASAVLERLDKVITVPLPRPVDDRSIAVVVCTRDRPEALRRCLGALVRQTLRPHEVVVVDNAPSTPQTKSMCEQMGVRYVLEERPGLSRARNRGIAQTTADIIAFTDDDVVVHENWLAHLVSGFVHPDVMSVTGLVLPAELDTAAARAFEASGGFGGGFRRREFDREWLMRRRSRGAHVWQIGAGASVAFRRTAFDRVGLFDIRLGAGAAGCSEDSELWFRLLAGGWTCCYEPSSVAFHFHRDSIRDLRQQVKAYMRGHVAALAVQWRRTRGVGELKRVAVSLPRYLSARLARRLVLGREDLTLSAEVRGYGEGLLRFAAMLRSPAEEAPQTRIAGDEDDRVPLDRFLATNPFPHRHSLGLFYAEKMRAIHAISPTRGVRRVVEVGGGQSGLAAALYPSATVLTLDLDRSYGARRDLYDQAGRGFGCADATRLPLADQSVDVVTLFDVCEHITDDAAALAEAVRVLRRGGTLLLTTPSRLWRFPYYRPFARFTPSEQEIMAEWGHVRRGYSVTELDRLVGQAHDALRTFITPVTVLAHDIVFSRLPSKVKRLLGLALAPVVAPAARLHASWGPGTEVALRWTKR